MPVDKISWGSTSEGVEGKYSRRDVIGTTATALGRVQKYELPIYILQRYNTFRDGDRGNKIGHRQVVLGRRGVDR